MDNLIVLAVIVFIIGTAVGYVLAAKKKGVKCIGCPDAKHCSGHCGSCSCGCGK